LFCKDQQSMDGFSYYCKDCHHQYYMQKRGDSHYRQQRALYGRMWYRRNKARRLRVGRAYYQSAKDRMALKHKEWRGKNRVRVRQLIKRWSRKHVIKCRLYQHAHRALRIAAPGCWSQEDINRLFHKQRGLCYYCKRRIAPSTYQIDHKMPLSRGGSNWPANLGLTCRSCNASKRAKTEEEYLLWRAKK